MRTGAIAGGGEGAMEGPASWTNAQATRVAPAIAASPVVARPRPVRSQPRTEFDRTAELSDAPTGGV